MTDNIVYQVNQGSMKLEKHGNCSSGKWMHHMNIQYFFMTDIIAANELNVEYCPILDMFTNYFTKPLQGSQFQCFQNLILRLHEHTLLSTTNWTGLALRPESVNKHSRLLQVISHEPSATTAACGTKNNSECHCLLLVSLQECVVEQRNHTSWAADRQGKQGNLTDKSKSNMYFYSYEDKYGKSKKKQARAGDYMYDLDAQTRMRNLVVILV